MIFKSIVNFDRFNLSLCACVLTTGVAGGGNKGWLPRKDRIALRNLEIHQKIGHLSVPGIDVVCDECQKSKWQKSPHGSARPDKYTNLPPFAQISRDFVGPFPDSVRGKSMALIAICDKTAFTFVAPLGSKVDAVDEIVKIVEGIRNRDSSVCGEKIVRTVRSDNEKLLRSSGWNGAMDRLEIAASHSAPYSPQMNGVAERFIRTLTGSLRSVLHSTDETLWCYAAEYVSYNWNRIPRSYKRFPQGDGWSPMEIRNFLRDKIPIAPKLKNKSPKTLPESNVAAVNYDRSNSWGGDAFIFSLFSTQVDSAAELGATSHVNPPEASGSEVDDLHSDHFGKGDSVELGVPSFAKGQRLRRFGLLSYVLKEPRGETTKLGRKYRVCVFLGYSQANSAWLFGTFVKNPQRVSGYSWQEFESTSAKFSSIMIKDINTLKEKKDKGILVSEKEWLELQHHIQNQSWPTDEVQNDNKCSGGASSVSPPPVEGPMPVEMGEQIENADGPGREKRAKAGKNMPKAIQTGD